MVAINNTSIVFQSIFTILNITVDQEDTVSHNNYYQSIGKEMTASKCYGIYGCFDLNPPWTSENRPVALLPESIRKVEPKFRYYTQEDQSIGTLFDLDVHDVILHSGIDTRLPLYVVVHGYTESGQHGWVITMMRELLRRERCNVIIVDWQGGSSPPYTQAVANIRLVAAITAHLLADYAQFTDYNLDHVHLIGHSLGAHLSGYIGYTLQDDFEGLMIGRISALDPAEPHFAKANRPVRLDKSAAKFVDIIHTDASQFIRGSFGMTEAIGHVDFYPNGGTDQPGCDKSVSEFAIEHGGLISGFRKFIGCNHVRSYLYFIESINSNCSFYGITCNSYEDFIAGNCFDCSAKGQFCMPMGFNSKVYYDSLVWKKAVSRQRGALLYLKTADVPPFCQNHYKTSIHISDSSESKKHGGEIGQLWLTMHETTDMRGAKTNRVPLKKDGYHEPGQLYTEIITADKNIHLKGIEVEWDYHSSVFNPLTWRLLTTPRLHLAKIKLESLFPKERISVCPKNKASPLITGIPQLMLPSYC